MHPASFGQWVKQRRKELDLTQDMLAQHVNCSLILIQKIEAGERRPSQTVAKLLAQSLAIPNDELPAFIHFARETKEMGLLHQRAPWRAMRRHFTNLPVPPTPLFGRQKALETIQEQILVERVRLLTLVGPPGIGKTRLACETAANLVNDFEDGVFLVALAAITQPEAVIDSLARILDLTYRPGKLLLEQVKGFLADKRLLLVLDNLEQVVSVAPVLAELLEACPWLQILATSRVSLHIRPERQYRVAPLELPPFPIPSDPAVVIQYPAIAFFMNRTQAMEPDFILTGNNASLVTEICLRLDGLPLAIELIASQVNKMPLPTLLQQLQQPFDLLAAGPRDLPARHQTLRDALQWSLNLLNPEERLVFVRLAAFVGGFTPQEAESVCATGLVEQISNILDSLVDKNLIQRQASVAKYPRFAMLKTIREYAFEQLEQSWEKEEIFTRHILWALDLVETPQSTDNTWLEMMEGELDNLRVALRRSIDRQDVETAYRLSASLARFWQLRGYLTEGLTWLQEVLNLQIDQSDLSMVRTRAKTLVEAGWLLRDAGNFVQMKVDFNESLELYQELGDQSGQAYALYSLGYATFLTGVVQQGIQMIQKSLALYRFIREKGGAGLALFMLGRISVGLGDYGEAKSFLKECLQIEKDRGSNLGLGRTYGSLGELAIFQGDFAPATSYLEKSLALLTELGEKQLAGWVLVKQAELAWYRGYLSEAHSFLEQSLQLAREHGYVWNEAYTLTYLGMVTLAAGDANRAQMYCEKSLAIFQDINSAGDIAQTQKDLARVMLLQKDFTRAMMLYKECFQVFVERGYQPDIIECMEGLATCLYQDDPIITVNLISVAQKQRQRIGAVLPPVHLHFVDDLLHSIHDVLSDDLFTDAWETGRSMTIDQAIERVQIVFRN